MEIRILFFLTIFLVFSCQTEKDNCKCSNKPVLENQLAGNFRNFQPRHEWMKTAFAIKPYFEIKQETFRVVITNNGADYISVYEIAKTAHGYIQSNRVYRGIKKIDLSEVTMISDTTFIVSDKRLTDIQDEIENSCCWNWSPNKESSKDALIESGPVYILELIDPEKNNCNNVDFNLVGFSNDSPEMKKIFELIIDRAL